MSTKAEKEQLKTKLEGEASSRLIFLQQQLINLTSEYESNSKKIQDEIERLSLQKEALTEYKIK